MDNVAQKAGPIGIFDSGYGGLTVFKAIAAKLPKYDYVYIGDNARSPYGNRSFDTVHQYTLECIKQFFKMGCPLVILACNTASAKALRTIQQEDLPGLDGTKRVLGVIRPTAEVIGKYTRTGSVGILGTKGTVNSQSYPIEIQKFFPDIRVYQLACPMWVPLVENNEHLSGGADYFIKKSIDALLSVSPDIDTLLLACTHYPLLIEKINKHLSSDITVVSQGDIIADSLAGYLQRHPDMEQQITQNGTRHFYTTDSPADFDEHGGTFFGEDVKSEYLHI